MPEKPFVINDRRKFTSEGELRHDAQPSSAEAVPPADEPGRSTDEPAAEPLSEFPAELSAEPDKPHREPLAFPAASPKTSIPEPGRSEDEPDPDDEDRPAARSHETIAFPSSPAAQASASPAQDPNGEPAEDDGRLPPLTTEQIEQARRAYAATVDRLDTALRANNLGAEPLPEVSFESLVQSLYMQALLQLGGAAEPGQPPRVDLLGSRQTIDMLAIIADKAAGNLSEGEDNFIQSALFELRMGFLEMTQALARQAATRQPGAPAPAGAKGPGIVR